MGEAATSFGWIAIMTRAFEADDVYAEIPAIIADMRAENLRLGGDDRAIGLHVCALIGNMAYPVFTPRGVLK